MKWLIGIDGGGTKTDAALCDETGRVHVCRTDGPTNPTSVPKETVAARLESILDALTAPLGGRMARIDGCFVGVGGGGIAMNRAFLADCLTLLLPGAQALANGSDSVNALTSGIGIGDGIVAIAGTGSSVFARVGGAMHQTGGWGYLLGDEGSGYDLGRRALVSALRALDGRGPETVLTRLCAEKLGMPVTQAVAGIYEKGRAFIADFAPVLLEARDLSDPVACEQAEQAVGCLCEAIRVAGARLNAPVKPVVMAGSVWQPGGFVEARTRNLLGEGFRLIRPTLPPLYGAILEAAALARVPTDEAFERTFRSTYK